MGRLLTLGLGAAGILTPLPCPDQAEVATQLARLSPRAGSLSPGAALGTRWALVLPVGGELRLWLFEGGGQLLAERRLLAPPSCSLRAAAAAAVIAAWELQFAAAGPALPAAPADGLAQGALLPDGGKTPLEIAADGGTGEAADVESRRHVQLRSTELVAPLASLGALGERSAKRSAEPAASKTASGATTLHPLWRWEFGLGGGVAAAPAWPWTALAFGAARPATSPLGVSLAVLVEGSRGQALGGGQVGWSRQSVALGPDVRLSLTPALSLSLGIGAAAALLTAQGQGYFSDGNFAAVDLGAGAAVRLSWALPPGAVWLGSWTFYWPGHDRLEAGPNAEPLDLPHWAGAVGLGLAFEPPNGH